MRVELQGKVEVDKVTLWTAGPGIELLGADGKNAVKLKIAGDAVPGVTWLAFENAEGISALRPFVVGTLTELSEKEPNNEPTGKDEAVALPVVVNGTLQRGGDVDVTLVDLQAGQTLVASVDAFGLFGSPMDATLQVADARGFVVAQNDDATGFDPRLTWTADKAGRYAVRIFAFPSMPNSTIAFSGAAGYYYRLTMTAGPAITRWTPGAATIGQESTLTGGGQNLGEPAPTLQLTPGDTGSLTPAVPEALVLAPVPGVPEPVVAATADNSGSQPQAVTVPVCLSGGLATPKAEQAWKFAGKKGQRLQFRVTTAALGSPLDAVLRVLDAGGKQLLEVDDTKNSSYEIDAQLTLPADGDYAAVVTERFWHGGPDYVYLLQISEPTPEAVLTVAQNSFTVVSGKPLEIPVTIDRRSGFKSPLQISIAGLPDGCKAEPVTSEPKGDSSKSVKLTINAEVTAAWTGKLQIIGEATEEPKSRATAAVAPADGQVAAPLAILRVLPKP